MPPAHAATIDGVRSTTLSGDHVPPLAAASEGCKVPPRRTWSPPAESDLDRPPSMQRAHAEAIDGVRSTTLSGDHTPQLAAARGGCKKPPWRTWSPSVESDLHRRPSISPAHAEAIDGVRPTTLSGDFAHPLAAARGDARSRYGALGHHRQSLTRSPHISNVIPC